MLPWVVFMLGGATADGDSKLYVSGLPGVINFYTPPAPKEIGGQIKRATPACGRFVLDEDSLL